MRENSKDQDKRSKKNVPVDCTANKEPSEVNDTLNKGSVTFVISISKLPKNVILSNALKTDDISLSVNVPWVWLANRSSVILAA